MQSGSIRIPYSGLNRQYATLKEEILDVSDRIYSSGRVLDGEHVAAFETAIGKRTNRSYAIAVNSGTQAILFALLHYSNIIETKNIALPAMSFVATANAPILTGYKPHFVDIDYHGMMDIDKLRLREHNISALMYVNLTGNMLEYDKLKVATAFFDKGHPIIEDAAQSFGASFNGVPSGKQGDCSILSFDPTKNLPNYGSGGMVLTDSFDLAEFVIDMRNNGKLGNHAYAGTNSKMSEVDCAQMLIKLNHFDAWQKRRAQIAAYYTNELRTLVDVPRPQPGVTHAWSKYVIKCTDRHVLQNEFTRHGIETKIHYSTPLNKYDLTFEYQANALPNATDYSYRALSLPIFPEMTDYEVEQVADVIVQFYNAY
jgi:dTDP-4-amino-4,6-dideoxygalactose transaminase